MTKSLILFNPNSIHQYSTPSIHQRIQVFEKMHYSIFCYVPDIIPVFIALHKDSNSNKIMLFQPSLIIMTILSQNIAVFAVPKVFSFLGFRQPKTSTLEILRLLGFSFPKIRPFDLQCRRMFIFSPRTMLVTTYTQICYYLADFD